jgi:nucleoside-diphosphate-sugar epimerase
VTAPVAVIGAGGRTGAAVCRALIAAGFPVRGVIRDAARRGGVPDRVDVAVAPDAAGQVALCADARSVICSAPAEAASALIAALPRPGPHCVLLGSTRRYTRFPEARARAVLALEQEFARSGLAGVLLHPTMIYGAAGENNVRRIAALARFGVIPLPGGGRSLIQPVHADDVARAVVAAVQRRAVAAEPIVLAGPEPIPYAAFVRAVARAAGRRVRVLAVPLGLARSLARLAALLPGLPRVTPGEIVRLTEDKAFDITPARRLLGFDPMPLAAGLALTFPRRDIPD